MSYSYPIFSALEDFLKTDDWHYEFNEEKEFFTAGVNLDCALDSCRLLLDVRDDKYISYAVVKINCPEKRRREMSIFLTQINYQLILGSFQFDMRDGEIRYKFAVDCDNVLPSREVIKDSIYIPIMMLKQYGDAFCKFMFSDIDAQVAFDELSKD